VPRRATEQRELTAIYGVALAMAIAAGVGSLFGAVV
jgi:hypothetical protein